MLLCIYIYITLLDINMWGNIVFTLCPMIFSKSKMARKVECHNRKFCFASFPFFLFFSEMWLKVSLFKSTKILVVSDVFFKETHRDFHMNRLTMGIQWGCVKLLSLCCGVSLVGANSVGKLAWTTSRWWFQIYPGSPVWPCPACPGW